VAQTVSLPELPSEQSLLVRLLYGCGLAQLLRALLPAAECFGVSALVSTLLLLSLWLVVLFTQGKMTPEQYQ
jgi:L-asparagine transporter-like permease